MTLQDLLNTVALHVHQQGCRSVSESGECLYRGPGGTKCAVGVLIPDEDYDQIFEGVSLRGLIDNDSTGIPLKVEQQAFRAVLEKLDLWEHREFLNDLQRVHDFWDGSSPTLLERLQWVSNKYGLEVPTLA